jgi:hypothetical protein
VREGSSFPKVYKNPLKDAKGFDQLGANDKLYLKQDATLVKIR